MNPVIADPAAAVSGAVLASDGEPIVADLEMMLEAPGRGEPARAGLVSGGIPILDRGEVVIIPLGWAPAMPVGNPEKWSALQSAMNALSLSVNSSCSYRHGDQMALDLSADRDSSDLYTDALLRAGARRALWWLFGDHAVVLVTQGAPLPAPMVRSSLHLLAASVDTPRDLHPVIRGAVDLAWDWNDVVAAAGREPNGD